MGHTSLRDHRTRPDAAVDGDRSEVPGADDHRAAAEREVHPVSNGISETSLRLPRSAGRAKVRGGRPARVPWRSLPGEPSSTRRAGSRNCSRTSKASSTTTRRRAGGSSPVRSSFPCSHQSASRWPEGRRSTSCRRLPGARSRVFPSTRGRWRKRWSPAAIRAFSTAVWTRRTGSARTWRRTSSAT